MEGKQPEIKRIRAAQEQIRSCSDRLMEVTKRTDSLCASLKDADSEEESVLLARVLMQDLSSIEEDLDTASALLRQSASGEDSVHLSLTLAGQLLLLCKTKRQWLTDQISALELRSRTRSAAEEFSDLSDMESVRAGLKNYSNQVKGGHKRHGKA